MNKIGIITNHISREEFEVVFSDILEKGGELLFASTGPAIEDILLQKPNVLLLDASFYDRHETEWKKWADHLVVLRKRGEKRGLEPYVLFYPFQPEEIDELIIHWTSKMQSTQPKAL